MSIHRIIYRIDYSVNFGILDSPGEIMKLLSAAPENFWTNYTDSTQQRQVGANFESDRHDLYRHVSVEPKTIVFSLETIAGVSSDALEKDDSYLNALEIIGKLLDRFSIDKVKRMGLRLFSFSKLADNLDQVRTSFRDSLSNVVPRAIEDSLGAISDYMLAFDGNNKDGIAYHARIGPYVPGEARKYFENLAKQTELLGSLDTCNFMSDIDLYEENFSLAKIPPRKWCRALVDKHRKAISASKAALTRAGAKNAN